MFEDRKIPTVKTPVPWAEGLMGLTLACWRYLVQLVLATQKGLCIGWLSEARRKLTKIKC